MIDLTQSALALVEGFGLALSPCILPILPLILASSASGNRWRPLQIVLGFIISFTIFSLVSRQILAATGIQQDQIQFGAFFLLLVFGIIMLVPKLEEKFASLTASIAGKAQNASNGKLANKPGGGFLIGALIGLVWTPCAGPILAVAFLQVIQSQTHLDTIATIGAFSIGASLPMLAIGYSGKTLIKYVQALSRHAVVIRRAMGVVIVVFSLMGLSGFNLSVWVVSQEAGATELHASNSLIDGLQQPYDAPAIAGITHWLNSNALDFHHLKARSF
ncbi:MAG: cytochrome c biogenesis CcdA family protein [Alphaproteobacteria bacterium]